MYLESVKGYLRDIAICKTQGVDFPSAGIIMTLQEKYPQSGYTCTQSTKFDIFHIHVSVYGFGKSTKNRLGSLCTLLVRTTV